MADLAYIEMAFACFMIVHFLYYRNKVMLPKNDKVAKSLLSVFLVGLIFTSIDILWGFSGISFLKRTPVYSILTYLYCASNTMVGYFYLNYILVYLKYGDNTRLKKPDEKELFHNRLSYTIRGLMYLCLIGVLIYNFFTDKIFYVDSEGKYIQGQYNFAAYVITLSFYIYGIGICIFHYIRNKDNKQVARRYIVIILAQCIMLASIVVQFFQEFVPTESMGFVISSLFIFTFNTTRENELRIRRAYDNASRKQREISEKKESLLKLLYEEYELVVFVEVATGKMQVYHSNSMYNDFATLIKKGMTYEIAYPEYIERFVADADKEQLRIACNPGYLKVIFEENDRSSVIYRTNRDGKEQYAELVYTKIPIPKQSGYNVVIGIADVNESLQKEIRQRAELEHARDVAEKASTAKSTFLFNMSHDIRTPMNAILGFASMAKDNIDSPEKALNYLDKVEISGGHLLELINAVLDMSRIESGKVSIDEVPSSIHKCAAENTLMVQQSAQEKGVDFTTSFKNIKHDMVYADALHVNQIMLNILGNAVKYTRPGGSVTYTIEEIESPDSDKAKFRFIVSDTGVGMSEEFLSHIYESFSREKSSTLSGVEGTGLGMSIAKRLVDLMFGELQIDSEIGIGTTVTCVLSFRISAEEETKTVPAPVKEREYDLHGKRVLLVEDNELNREIAKNILENAGMNVEEAEDGAIAVEMVRDKKPGYYNFVLMDIQMPYMDGYRATQAIRALKNKKQSSVPIIAMTANAFEEDKEKALAAGMDDHLAKPINRKLLLETLQKFAENSMR